MFHLELYLSDVVRLSPDALNSNAFRTVKKLLLENYELATMEKGIFNGLNELEIVNIRSAGAVNIIETGVLDTLTELQEFTFEQSLKNNPYISIDGLTGSEALSKLEYVKIRYNLANSIKKSTFVGLINVKRLDLSTCQIQSIEDSSFDPISETIEELDLSGNLLTTLSDAVFHMLLPNIKSVDISGNSWDCECHLLHLRLFIEQYQHNFNGYNCSTPASCRSNNLLECENFSVCEMPSTSTPTTTSTTTTTPPPNTNFTLQCQKRNELAMPDTVSIKRPIGSMTISEAENGELNLNIELEQDATSPVVVWFDENQNSGGMAGEDISCVSRNGIESIPITNLLSNVTYTFCLMDKSSTSVSPLDCISYAARNVQIEPVWLYESSKTLTITLAVIVLTINVMVGIAIGFWMLKFNPFSKHKFSRESIDSVNSSHNT